MKCHTCGGELQKIATDLPFKLSENSIVIVKGLPVLQCEECPQYVIENSVMSKVDSLLEKVGAKSELEVVRYAA